MSDVVIYHPVTEAIVAVPDSALPHYRMSGWLLLDEHNANQAAAAEREAASKTAAKSKE